MKLLSYKDYINRLLVILENKKLTDQKKLAEIDKINKVKIILNKFKKNEIKTFIELNDLELIQLFSQYCNISFNLKDISVKKYWLNEGTLNSLIKSSSQYINAYNEFIGLIDKMQMYYDYSSSFTYNKQDILLELNLIDSLKSKIVNNDVIMDLSPYYCLFNNIESVSDKLSYLFIAAISYNNVDNDFNVKSIDKLIIDNELVMYIKDLLKELVQKIEKNIIDNNSLIEKISELKSLKNRINNNYELLYDIYPNILCNIMNEVWDKEDIDYYIERLAIPVALIKGKNKGLDLNLTDEDKQILEDFTDDINNKLNKMLLKQEEYNKENISKNSDINCINELISKLDTNSDKILNFNDYNIIINLLLDNKKDYNYINNCLNMLNRMIINNILRFKLVDNDKSVKVKNNFKENNIEIDKKIMKKLEILFNKYGFNYDAFSKNILFDLLSNTDFDSIKSMIEYINLTEELSFLKDYTFVTGKSSIDKEIQEIKCSQICFIFAYSSQEILNNLIKISKEDKIELYDIFSIPKVFASKNNDKVKGSYEDFILNEKLLKEDYPNILCEIVSNYPFILATDSNLFRNNIDILSLYGLNISNNSNGLFPSPLCLTNNNLEYLLDRYIEVEKYDYVELYRSVLNNNQTELNKLYKDLKGIDIKNKKIYNTSVYFDNKIENFLNDTSLENIPVAFSESVIKKLDKINEEKDEKKKKIQYIIDGIYISRIKVLKYFSTLMINKYKNKKEALLYSIIKDSYLTKNEFDRLKNIIYGGK